MKEHRIATWLVRWLEIFQFIFYHFTFDMFLMKYKIASLASDWATLMGPEDDEFKNQCSEYRFILKHV